jgi:NADH-quinone oxidoreductase subunit G
VTLPYDTIDQLRTKLMGDHPTFGRIDYVGASGEKFDLKSVGEKGALSDAAFVSPVGDFYLTNPIARASVTMAECSALAVSRRAPLAAE